MSARCVRALRARGVRIRLALTTLLMVVVAASCATDLGGLPTYWNFKNQTDEAIAIVWHRENGEQIMLVKEVSAGESASVNVNPYGNPREACGDGELVAVDPAGREIARSPTNCNPWVIESSEPPE
jgi:hypothetical protein